MIEQMLVAAFFLGVGVFGIYQYRKTVRLRKAYLTLSKPERDRLDQEQWHDPKLFAYSKPMSKGMWFSAVIAILVFIWALIDNAVL